MTPSSPDAPPAAPADEQASKSFAAFVHEQRQGGLHGEASDALAELVAAVVQHEKGGTFTLKLSVAPGPTPGSVVVRDDVRIKAPEADKSAALFFADDDGNLSRRDPRQLEMTGLREVPAARDDEAPREVQA